MTQEEIQQHTKQIQEIYRNYISQLFVLKRERSTIISDFVRLLEQSKIDDIKKQLDL